MCYRYTIEPYIIISQGEDFADSFNIRFFIKTFPTLFLYSKGSPHQAEEYTIDIKGDGPVGFKAAVAL